MFIIITGLLILLLLGVGLFYHISYIITIINNPLITLTLFDYLIWFVTCVIIVLIILDILIIKDEIEYLI